MSVHTQTHSWAFLAETLYKSGSSFFASNFLFLVISLLAVLILSCGVRPPPSVVVSSSPWPRQPQQHNSSDASPAVTNTWKSDWLRRLPWGFIWKQKKRNPTTRLFNCFLCRLLRRKGVGLKCTFVAAEFGTRRRSQAAFTCATCRSAAENTPDSSSFCQSCVVTSYIHPREAFSHSSPTLWLCRTRGWGKLWIWRHFQVSPRSLESPAERNEAVKAGHVTSDLSLLHLFY